MTLKQKDNKCEKCGGETKTLSAVISNDEQQHVCVIECTMCKNTETVVSARIGAPKQIDMIV